MLSESTRFLQQAPLRYDAFIDHKEFDRLAGLSYPRLSEIDSQAELEKAIKKFDLLRLRVIEEVRNAMLVEHKMLLASVRGEGFRIVMPEEQTLHVLESGSKELARAFNKMGRGLANVNRELLNASALAENDLAQAKVGSLRGLVSHKTLIGERRKRLK